jgi:hypothetical protein
MNTVSVWFSKLKISVTSGEDVECSGHPSTSKTDTNVDQVSEL